MANNIAKLFSQKLRLKFEYIIKSEAYQLFNRYQKVRTTIKNVSSHMTTNFCSFNYPVHIFFVIMIPRKLRYNIVSEASMYSNPKKVSLSFYRIFRLVKLYKTK